jgi:hypothetical protein
MFMKVREAIDRIDSLKHNTYTYGEKIEWLSRLDGIIKDQIIDTHEDGDDIVFEGYTDNDMESDLLVKAPYDEMYIRWLEAQIDYYNGEIARYNNSMLMFQTAYEGYQKYYNRSHMPLGQKVKYFGSGTTQVSNSAKGIVDISIKEV